MSVSNCCLLTCVQISLEAGQVVWYSHLWKNSPQFVVIHTAKGFGIVNKEKVDVFLEHSYFFNDPTVVGNLIFGSSAVSKSSLNILKSYGQRFMTLDKRQWSRSSPKEKKCKKAKWFSEEAFKIAEKRREEKAKEKMKDIHIWMQISKE